jgi:hypothetical protein
MSKKKKRKQPESLDINHFIHQPHDKYVRAMLQSRVIVMQIIELVLPKHIFCPFGSADDQVDQCLVYQ